MDKYTKYMKFCDYCISDKGDLEVKKWTVFNDRMVKKKWN